MKLIKFVPVNDPLDAELSANGYLETATDEEVQAFVTGLVATWRDGSGAPDNTLGINGDYYLDNDTGDVYLKSGGSYAIVVNIKGTDGISFTWRGPYQGVTPYAVNDVVQFAGNSYVCIISANDQTPIDYPSYWQLMAQKGADGEDGTNAPGPDNVTLDAGGDGGTLRVIAIPDNVLTGNVALLNGTNTWTGVQTINKLNLPVTTATDGIIKQNGSPLLHTYFGGASTNLFLGPTVGNFTNTAAGNIAVGENSMSSVGAGSYNVAIGRVALRVLSSGGANVAIGDAAMYSLSSGNGNCAVGSSCMQNANGGNFNTGVGSSALFFVTGDNNVGIGGYAGQSLTSGERNMLQGASSFFQLTSGSDNVGIGYSSGQGDNSSDQASVTDSKMIFIGTAASRNVAAATILTNAGALGYGAKVAASNCFVLGDATTYALNIGIGVLAPTARLHLPAGIATAGKAPLKLTSGTNLTTEEDGAFEYDGTHLYFTIGSTRNTLI